MIFPRNTLLLPLLFLCINLPQALSIHIIPINGVQPECNDAATCTGEAIHDHEHQPDCMAALGGTSDVIVDRCTLRQAIAEAGGGEGTETVRFVFRQGALYEFSGREYLKGFSRPIQVYGTGGEDITLFPERENAAGEAAYESNYYAVLDGKEGNAYYTASSTYGFVIKPDVTGLGGMAADFRTLHFRNWVGGVLYVQAYQTTTVTWCMFSYNGGEEVATGGAIYVVSSIDFTLTRTIFYHNDAEEGGAFAGTSGASFKLDKVLFVDNMASVRNSAISLSSTTAQIGLVVLDGNAHNAPSEWSDNCALAKVDSWTPGMSATPDQKAKSRSAAVSDDTFAGVELNTMTTVISDSFCNLADDKILRVAMCVVSYSTPTEEMTSCDAVKSTVEEGAVMVKVKNGDDGEGGEEPELLAVDADLFLPSPTSSETPTTEPPTTSPTSVPTLTGGEIDCQARCLVQTPENPCYYEPECGNGEVSLGCAALGIAKCRFCGFDDGPECRYRTESPTDSPTNSPTDSPTSSPTAVPTLTGGEIDCQARCLSEDPEKPCYYEPECNGLGGEYLGCGALGIAKCRYCGFGDYTFTVCRERTGSPTPSPSPAPTTSPSPAPTTSPSPAPTNSPHSPPIVRYSGASIHSSCGDVILDATTSSTSSPSSTFSSIQWGIAGDSPPRLLSEWLSAYNAHISAYETNSLSLTIPADRRFLKPDRVYTFFLKLTNEFSLFSTLYINVDMSSENIPYAHILSPDIQTTRLMPITLTLSAKPPPPCDVCDDSKCSSFHPVDGLTDCCEPQTLPGWDAPDNAQTCRDGYTPIQTSDGCDIYAEGLYECCAPPSTPSAPTTLSYAWTVSDVTDESNHVILPDLSSSASSHSFTIPPDSLTPTNKYRVTASVSASTPTSLPYCHVVTLSSPNMGEYPAFPNCLPNPNTNGTTPTCVNDPNGLVSVDDGGDCELLPGTSGLWASCSEIWHLCPLACVAELGSDAHCSPTEPAAAIATSFDYVDVTVSPSPLAVTLTPETLTTSTMNELVLDASASNDPDDPTTLLSFTWSVACSNCRSTGMSISSVETMLLSQRTSSVVAFPPSSLPPSAILKFVVTANTLKGPLKVSSAYAMVTAQNATFPFPDVSVFSPAGSVVNLPNHPLAATVSVFNADVQAPLVYAWSVDGGVSDGVSGDSFFVGSSTFSSAAVNINALQPALPYVFTLSVTDALGGVSTSSVSLTLNTPPSLGSFAVSPSSGGIALDTAFEILASSFDDPDLPLSYTFYKLEATSMSPLKATSASNVMATMLPPGELTLRAVVEDAYGSSTTAETSVKVEKNSQPVAVTARMKELILEGENSMDGETMAYIIQIGVESGGDCDIDWMLNKLSSAFKFLGADSSAGLGLVAGSLAAATNKVDSVSGLSDYQTAQSFALMQKLVGKLHKGDANSVAVMLDSMSNLVPSGELAEVDALVGKMWNRIVLADRMVPGMEAAEINNENLELTCGAFRREWEGKGVNVTSRDSWFHFSSDGKDSSAFGAAIVKLPRDTMTVTDSENKTLVSDGVMVSLTSPEGQEKGVDYSANVTFAIPLLPYDGATNVTDDWYNCAVELSPGDWDTEGCEKVALTGESIVCRCSAPWVNQIERRVLVGNESSGEGGDSSEDSVLADIGDAFFRAGAVLMAPVTLKLLEQQMAILIVLGAIYCLYFVVLTRALVSDRLNVKARHEELLESEFVEKAIRAMRENFLRIELANKNDVIDPNHVGLSPMERMSSQTSNVSTGNSRPLVNASPRATARTTASLTQGLQGGESAGLDAFTNRRLTKQMRKASETFLNRGSSANSFDDEMDDEVLNFLATNERQSEEKSRKGGDSFSSFGPDEEGEGGEAEALTSDALDALDRAETRANMDQEDKLRRLRKDRLGQFWKGIKKEHDFFVVFGGQKNKRRGSAVSVKSASTYAPTTPSTMTFFAKTGSDKKLGSGALTGTSSSWKDTSGNETSGAETIGRRGSNESLGGSGRGGDLTLAQTSKQKAEALQDLEEYVNVAHRSTVLLCQFLSFLAMAVFFYEEAESLLNRERWDQIRGADTVTGFFLVLENVLEGFVQVILTFPVLTLLTTLFRQLDEAGTAKVLFETRVANDQAKLLHGISQDNPVDLRRSIHEVEGLLRIVGRSKKKSKEDVMVVKYTLELLRAQLQTVREKQKVDNQVLLERQVAAARAKAKTLGDVQAVKDIMCDHKLEIKRRREVEDVLVKMCSLDPVRQALFLKDRRAMNHMHGGVLARFKRSMYKIFIAEKEGYVPDDVSFSRVVACEIIAGLYIAFLTWYLYKHALVVGSMTTLTAVLSFLTELAISFIVVSPMFIFVKFVVIPSVVAGLVESDVKRAQATYREKVTLRRQKAGRLASVGEEGGGMVGRMGRAISRASKRMSRAVSLGGVVEGRERGSSGGSVGFLEEGGEDGIEMNPIRRESRAKTYYDGDGNPYFEGVDGVASYDAPEGWYDDREDDEFDGSYDESSGGTFYINRRTRRTTWTEKGGGGGDVGRAGEMVEMAEEEKEWKEKSNWGKVKEAVGAGGAGGGWDAVLDAASGQNYFVNRETRATTWTDRSGESGEETGQGKVRMGGDAGEDGKEK